MKTNIKRWPYLFIGSIAFLFAGLVYGWPIFSPIFASEFPSWNTADLALTFTFCMSFFCIGNLLGGPIANKISPRATMIIAAALISLGFIGTTAVQENTIILLYLTYGVIASFGIGIIYNITLTVVTKWFPEKVGTASGVLMMSFAISTLFLGTPASYLMLHFGWRYVFIALGILTGSVLVIASILLKYPGKDVLLPAKTVKEDESAGTDKSFTALQMVKSKSFWLFMLWGVFVLVSVFSLMGSTSLIASDIGASATLATLSVSIIGISNGLGRLILGSAYDKFGRRKAMLLGSSFLLLSGILIIGAFKTGSIALMVAGFILCGIAYGGVPSMGSAFIVDYYGSKGYSLKFGIVSLYILFGSLGSYLAGVIKMATGSFETVFYVVVGFEILAVVVSLFISKKQLASLEDGKLEEIETVNITTAKEGEEYSAESAKVAY